MNYKLSNSFLEVEVCGFGAELKSLKKQGEVLEYLWQADEKYWARTSPVLFPIVGKLIDNTYTYQDKSYNLPQHGFARDNCFEVFEQTDASITFRFCSSKETLENYPFEFELYIIYTLKDAALEVAYKVMNKTNDNMLFSIGAHPAFNWPLEEGNKENYYFEFKEQETLSQYQITSEGIALDKRALPSENNRLQLTEQLFKDDALIFDDLKHKTIALKNSQNSRAVKLKFDGFDYLGLWSKAEGASFVCIEPWCGIADFVNHNQRLEDKRGIITLDKAEIFEASYTIEIE